MSLFVVLCTSSLRYQPLESVQVDRRGGGAEQVAPGPPDDPHLRRGAEDPAQPGQVAVERFPGALRNPVGPHPVDELVNRHAPLRVRQERDQYASLSGMAEIDDVVVDLDLHITEEPEINTHIYHPPARLCPVPSFTGIAQLSSEFKKSRRPPYGHGRYQNAPPH
jgi:hypothetical protein